MRKKTTMDFQEVVRKQRPMKAVQVTFSNAAEVAAWCEGIVVMSTVRLGGTDTQLPAVQLNRPSKGGRDYTTALVTFWIVQYPGEFRIFKDAQYQALFETVLEAIPGSSVDNPIVLREGDCVFQNTGVAITIPDNALTKITLEGASTAFIKTSKTPEELGLTKIDVDKNKFATEHHVFDGGLHLYEGLAINDDRRTDFLRKREIENEMRDRNGVCLTQNFEPFAEPSNSTPAGESLEFEVDAKVQVQTKDSEWYQWDGVVKYVNDDVVGVAFMEDVVSAREFHPTELKRV